MAVRPGDRFIHTDADGTETEVTVIQDGDLIVPIHGGENVLAGKALIVPGLDGHLSDFVSKALLDSGGLPGFRRA